MLLVCSCLLAAHVQICEPFALLQRLPGPAAAGMAPPPRPERRDSPAMPAAHRQTLPVLLLRGQTPPATRAPPWALSAGASDPDRRHRDGADDEAGEAAGEAADLDAALTTRMEVRAGTLYIVATPIGNLGDITLRAVEVLRSVDIVASEDTRRTSRLLKHLQLPFTKLISHHEHNWRNSAPEIVAMAQAGQSIALVSDAGTPGICDPGMQLVDACIKAGVRVEPIPGACAAAAAVSVAGARGIDMACVIFPVLLRAI